MNLSTYFYSNAFVEDVGKIGDSTLDKRYGESIEMAFTIVRTLIKDKFVESQIFPHSRFSFTKHDYTTANLWFARRKIILDVIIDLLQRTKNFWKEFTQLEYLTEADIQVVSMLPNAINEEYQAMETTPDGNCLFYAISMTLCGSKYLGETLRILIAYLLIEHKDRFIEVIGKHQANLSEDERLIRYYELIKIAYTDKAYGNEYHLLALATLLQRPIYSYSNFRADLVDVDLWLKDEENKIEHKQTTCDELVAAFNDRRNYTGNHLKYLPLEGIFPVSSTQEKKKCLCIHYDKCMLHYTALIPKKEEVHEYIPKSNLFDQVTGTSE